jgi:hypothetical protein
MGYMDVNWPYLVQDRAEKEALVNTIVVGPAAAISILCNIQV